MAKSYVLSVDEVNKLRSTWPATYEDLAASHEALRDLAADLASALDQQSRYVDAEPFLAKARAAGLLQ